MCIIRSFKHVRESELTFDSARIQICSLSVGMNFDPSSQLAVINGCLAALRAAIKNSKINKKNLIGINISESQLSIFQMQLFLSQIEPYFRL